MKRHLLLALLFFSFFQIHSQNGSPWKRVAASSNLATTRWNVNGISKKELLFELDKAVVKRTLEPLQEANNPSQVVIEIPNTKGELEKYEIHEFSNFDTDLQTQFPSIRAYVGTSLSDKTATLYCSFSPKGIQTMVLRSDKPTEFIEKISGNQEIYRVFDSNDKSNELALYCATMDKELNKPSGKLTTAATSNGESYKTLRLAVACTAEYTTYFGGTFQALEAINATLTRVNGIFNKDLSLHLNLISSATALLYTNPATDPFSPANSGANGNWNVELQRDLTAKIGNANYDIGHLFGASGGGGNAGCIGCVCQDPVSLNDVAKGGGFSSPADGKPEGDTFDIDFVAHEIGHQLGANHTFSHETEGTGVNVEPGGGSTIMSYAGVTDYNIQSHSDDYFAYVSIDQIRKNLASKSCPVSSIIPNTKHKANAGEDFVIPKSTPFVLKGSSSNPNGAALSYCWEQNDTATTSFGANSIAFPTKKDGPLFRSFPPTNSPNRFMPELAKVVSNSLNSQWESVADIARTMHFTLTVRDNGGIGLAQTDTDAMTVTVDATKGPFEITSQNTSNLSWKPLSLETINWAVNSTDQLPGSANVNIKLSIDGGLTFPIFLKTNTPNDGSERIFVPNGILGKNCRILIEPTNNIFFAINKEPFAIGYSIESSCTTYAFETPIVIPESASYTAKTITVPTTSGAVSDVNVDLSFTHQYLSDVQIELVNPQGKTVKLFENGCSDTNGSLVLKYDDLGGTIICGKQTMQTVAPFEPLYQFNERNPSGTWTLRVRDAIAGDTGTINSATISICTKSFTPMALSPIDLTKVMVYPNPNQGDFVVLFSSQFNSGVTIIIHDLLGKKIYEKGFPSAQLFNEAIHLESVQAGMYLLTVIDGSTTTVKKIIIN
ncbi:reprolysin-like metallopeptidase [Flavobacterium ammoniigenes]|jgi:subtilisin-like proprotein convertase family protein|uniref:reprolysin-like metallopeptidase n=1 Tax=Flavobacterium ammoniigenes TaxID=1751095 RepID=UPI001E51A305|nr:zinc-dependent metalloprotease family protein [Flavobacterium ammoniigenes]